MTPDAVTSHTMPTLSAARPVLPLGRWAWAVYGVLLWALFFPSAELLLRRVGWLPFHTTTLFVLLLLPAVGVAVWQGLPARGPSPLLDLLRANGWILGLLALPVALTFLASLVPGSVGGARALFRPLASLVTVMVAMVALLVPGIRRHWRLAVRSSWALLVASMAIDVVAPGTFARRATRAAGLAVDANLAAFLVVLAAALLVGSARSRRDTFLTLGVSGLAVVAALSRGGLLLLLLLVGLTIFLPPDGAKRDAAWKRLAVVGLLVAATIGAVVAVARSGLGLFRQELTQDRLASVGGGEAWNLRGEARLELVRVYSGYIAEAPWLGHGAGFLDAQPVGPHNRFLFEWVSLGVLGPLSYAAFLAGTALVFWRRRFLPGVYVILIVAGWSVFHHLIFELRGVVLAVAWSAGLSSLQPGTPRGAGG